MQELVQRILDEGEHIGDGIVKVDSFLNHQVDPQLTWRMAKVIHDSFLAEGVRRITRVLTAEVSADDLCPEKPLPHHDGHLLCR